MHQVNYSTPNTESQPKVRLPDPFDGDRRQLRGFLNQLRLVWRIQPRRYPTDAIKVALLGTLLKGSALQWFSPLLEADDPRLNNADTIIQLLEDAFGDPDRQNTASRKIEMLSQGRRPASVYASEFRLIAGDLDWNDSAKMHQFQRGLNHDLKQLLLSKSKPTTSESAINDAIECDNRLFELRSSSRANRILQYVPLSATGTTNANSLPPTSDPMILDGALPSQPRAPLTPEERRRRMDNRLCLYCAEERHIALNCPRLTSRISGNVNRRG